MGFALNPPLIVQLWFLQLHLSLTNGVVNFRLKLQGGCDEKDFQAVQFLGLVRFRR
jgi:hypothetical protein